MLSEEMSVLYINSLLCEEVSVLYISIVVM